MNSPARSYIDSFAPGPSRMTVQGRLNVAARLLGYDDFTACPWPALTRVELMSLRVKLVELVDSDQYIPRYGTAVLLNVKGVLKEAWEQDLIETEVYQRAVAVKTIQGARKRRPQRTLTDHEFKLLLLVCEIDRTARGLRDSLIVALSATVGLRIGEHAELTLEDIRRDERLIRIRKGKGDRSRDVPLAKDVIPYLDAWLVVRGMEPGPLFCHVTRGGDIKRPLRGLTADRFDHVLKARGESAGVQPFSSHATRRGCYTRLVDELGETAIVSRIMGHKTDLSHLYFNPEKDRTQAAVNAVGVPDPRYRPPTASPEDREPAPPPMERILAATQAMERIAGALQQMSTPGGTS